MKRPNGFGTIEELPTGWFRVRRAGGKRETLGTFETRERAESMLRGWNAGIASGDIADGTGITLAAFGEAWLVRRRHGGNAHARKVKDINNEESVWSMHVAPSALAAMPLDSIRRIHVEDWICELSLKNSVSPITKGGKVVRRDSGKRLSPATIRHALRLVRQCFADAVARELITRNPAEKVAVYAETSHRTDGFLTTAEIAKLESLPADKRIPILFTMYTGARQSEMWRLTWADVDVDGARFWIRGDTKNGKARKAPLLPVAIALLEEQKALSNSTEPHDYVFPGPKGKRWAKGYDLGWADKPQRNTKGEFRITPGLRSRVGITRHIRFHDLRHTCASHLLMGSWGAAWRLEEVREYLAHSSISVTERYAHLTRGHLDTLAARTVAQSGPEPKEANLGIALFSGADNGGFEPSTLGSGGRGDLLGITGLARGLDDSRATEEIAQMILRSVANGGADRANLEALAMRVLARDDVRLAAEILADLSGPHALRRAVELAALLLETGVAHTQKVERDA